VRMDALVVLDRAEGATQLSLRHGTRAAAKIKAA
jgi:hypothetical protein